MPVTEYYWDELSDNVLMEADENGAPTAVYTNEPNVFGELISQERAGEESFYHFDGQGSTRQLTDASGAVTDEYTYTAFGEVVEKTGSTVNPWSYKGATGYYANPQTDDLYIRARTFAPTFGRWLSINPINAFEYVDGHDAYSYVGNAPMQDADPRIRGAWGNPNASMVPFVPGIRILEVSKSGCWEVSFGVKFEVPPHINTGFVIQEINTTTRVYNCDGADITWKIHGTRPTRYWEAISISGIRLRARIPEPDDSFDVGLNASHTKGTHEVRGIAKGPGNIPLPEGFAQGIVPEAVEFPATYDKPRPWDNFPGVAHNLTIKWDCCCEKECLLVYTTPQWAIDLPFGVGVDPSCPEQIPIYR